MNRRRNHCVYTGRVGAKMAPRNYGSAHRAVRFDTVLADGGPYHGQLLSLEKNGDNRTALFTVGRWRGHYSAHGAPIGRVRVHSRTRPVRAATATWVPL